MINYQIMPIADDLIVFNKKLPQVILDACEARLEEAGSDIEALGKLLEQPDRPYTSGEGPIKTTAMTVSKYVAL